MLVHSEIESHTPSLIQAYNAIFAGLGVPVSDAAADISTAGSSSSCLPQPTASPPAVNAASIAQVQVGLDQLQATLERIVVSQIKMFNASDPRSE